MLKVITREQLKLYRERYQNGTRVKLILMTDPYNNELLPGATGTVDFVDDLGTVHVNWDNGSTLGLVYREDYFEIID